MSLMEKIKSRKLWMAGAGMVTGVSTDNALLTVLSVVAYVLGQALVDTFGNIKSKIKGSAEEWPE